VLAPVFAAYANPAKGGEEPATRDEINALTAIVQVLIEYPDLVFSSDPACFINVQATDLVAGKGVTPAVLDMLSFFHSHSHSRCYSHSDTHSRVRAGQPRLSLLQLWLSKMQNDSPLFCAPRSRYRYTFRHIFLNSSVRLFIGTASYRNRRTGTCTGTHPYKYR
jgi:hypothetical protein